MQMMSRVGKIAKETRRGPWGVHCPVSLPRTVDRQGATASPSASRKARYSLASEVLAADRHDTLTEAIRS
jgi:hypothetical protein